MGQYSSYYLYQKYEKRGEQDWIPCYPNTYSISGDSEITMPIVEKSSADTACGYVPPSDPQYSWNVVDGYVCDDCDDAMVLIHTSADTIYISGSGEVSRTDVSGYTSAATDAVITSYATSIGNNAFSGFSSIEFIRIPSTVMTIGDRAFYGCSAMTECQIPYGCTSIGASAFTNSISLSYVDIPSTVTSLGDNCFRNCLNFRYISIPSSITSIPNNCFENCDGLSDIELPSSITSIGDMTFKSCSGLYSITINSQTPPTLGYHALYDTNIGVIYVPCGSLFSYRTASGWSEYSDIIKGISPCSEDMKFKATYTSGTSYSAECDSSTELTTATTKPNGYKYSAMTTAEIGSCVTSIGYGAFRDCTNLSNVTIGNNVTSIGSYAFNNCRSLANVTIPNSCNTIGDRAFEYCRSVTSIEIPNNVTTVGSYAFSYCTSLISVTIGNGVTSIADGTFYECSGLTSIVIPSGVTSIGNSAFRDCSGLTSVTIGSGVTNIGYSAFYMCASLTSITVEATTPPTLGNNYVFYNTNNCPIYVPTQSVDVYKAASGWSNYTDRIQAITS